MTKVEAPKAEKKTDPQAIITVDDKEYKFEDLTDEQKTYFVHMQDLNRKINTTRFNLDQLNVGMDRFKSLFVESLKASDSESEKDKKEDAK
jgi:hypothetical protein|tara:strand:- start:1556 stop:1828 length:273 start_codon:yes stop_codon:yes gene_type:complete